MRAALINRNRALVGDVLSVRPAWGVGTRRETRRYNGPCGNVRRSSDNATLDVFFAGNVLDVEAIRSFAGAGGSAYFVSWYEQFGSSASVLTQATNAAQPRILNAGVLELSGGGMQRPGVRGFGGQSLTATTPPFTAAAELTMMYVNAEASSLGACQLCLNQASQISLSTFNSFNYVVLSGTNSVAAHTVTVGQAYQMMGRNSVAANVRDLTVNGVVKASSTGVAATANKVQLFDNGSASQYVNGTISEVLLFNSSIPTADVTKAYTNQQIFYGL